MASANTGCERATCKDGPNVQFVIEPEEKYTCSNCGKILTSPVLQTQCGHRISRTCCEKMFHDDVQNVPCPAGDEECTNLVFEEMHPDRATGKELDRTEVYCAYRSHGCEVKGPWGKIEAHENTCPNKVQVCPNKGCPISIKTSDIENHVRNECDHTIVACENCEEQLPRHEIRNGHLATCIPKSKPCPLTTLGCDFYGLPKEIDEHLLKAAPHHLKIMATSYVEFLKEKTNMSKSLAANTFAIEKVMNLIQSQSQSSAGNDDKMSKVLDSINKKLLNLETRMDETIDESQFTMIMENVAKYTAMSERHEQAIQDFRENSREPSSMQNVTAKLNRLEASFASCETKTSEADIRFRLLETASYNAKLLWKITQYQRRKSDAMDGRTVSLYSQPFYTSLHGYKMCGRVYLNGDGLGKGTHISLFFVIMRGEYDAILSWPFRPKVTLTIIDQSGNRRHITDSFRPDPTSASFRRPVQEMNIASGSPMFAKHEQIESDNYVKDDTLFIKITVDTTDLVEI